MQKLLYILITAGVLLVVIRYSIGYFSADRLATGLTVSEGNQPTLSGCDGLQNCTSSTASSKVHHIDAISIDADASTAIAKIAAVIASQDGTEIAAQSPIYVHATYKTKLMGFTDDLEVLLDETTGVLNIRSASRIGKSDLGANRKRIDALRKLLLQH